jgi:hypothetical protein
MKKFSAGVERNLSLGEVCDTCEFLDRKKTIGCMQTGCPKFKIVAEKEARGALHYRVDCPHCRQWRTVLPGDGLHCGVCGMDASYACSVASQGSMGRAIKAVEGMLDRSKMDDVEYQLSRPNDKTRRR